MFLYSSACFQFCRGEEVHRVVTARGKVNQNGDKGGRQGGESKQCSTPLARIVPLRDKSWHLLRFSIPLLKSNNGPMGWPHYWLQIWPTGGSTCIRWKIGHSCLHMQSESHQQCHEKGQVLTIGLQVSEWHQDPMIGPYVHIGLIKAKSTNNFIGVSNILSIYLKKLFIAWGREGV